MIKAILVDDEPLILEELKQLLESQAGVRVVAAYTDPLRALKEISATAPDCAFLDIEMPNITGIELAERFMDVAPMTHVVFITAYNHYATQAFDVSALDYLLKPIRPERIAKALEKTARQMKSMPMTPAAACAIRCFGAFDILMDGKPVKWSRYKSKELLAYLLQNEGRRMSKFKLCEEQWRDYPPDQALAYLQTSVYALRKSLWEISCTQIDIEYSDDRYCARVREDAQWDVRRFHAAYQKAVKAGSAALAQEALAGCQGEYLEAEDWPWSDITREAYERKRETLRGLCTNGG